MISYGNNAKLCERKKIDGVWYYKFAEGTEDEITEEYEHDKQISLEDKSQLKLYKITNTDDVFYLWKSVYSEKNILTYPETYSSILPDSTFYPELSKGRIE